MVSTTNSPASIENVRAARCSMTLRRSRTVWSSESRAASASTSISSRSGVAAIRRVISATCAGAIRWWMRAIRAAESLASGEVAATTVP